MAKQEELNKIDIISLVRVLFRALKRFWLPIVLVVALTSVVSYVYAEKKYTPIYQAQATFTVSVDKRIGNSSNTDRIKESLPYILNSTHLKNLVKDDLGISYFPATLEVSSGQSADYYVLKVNSGDPETAYNVLTSVLDNCTKVSIHVLGNMKLSVLDSSGIPAGPSNYLNKRLILGLGAAIGIFVSGLFLLVYVLTNRTIQEEEDLKKYLSVSCLAVIPKVVFKKRGKRVEEHMHIHNDRVGYGFLESVRAMRVRIQRAMEQMNARVIMVTSSVPQEGKSTLAANLALALAEVGSSVMLVDLDLRNPSIAEILGTKKSGKEAAKDRSEAGRAMVEDGRGMAGAGKEKAGEAGTEAGAAEAKVKEGFREEKFKLQFVKIKKWNLDMMHVNEPQNNPLEILGKRSFAGMINGLRDKYDYVVIDTPPAALLSDASAIAKYVDCAVYVVKQDYTRIERIVEGMDSLTFVQVPVLGVVLNGAEKGMSGYASYRYGDYGVQKKAEKSAEAAGNVPEYVDVSNPWESGEK